MMDWEAHKWACLFSGAIGLVFALVGGFIWVLNQMPEWAAVGIMVALLVFALYFAIYQAAKD